MHLQYFRDTFSMIAKFIANIAIMFHKSKEKAVNSHRDHSSPVRLDHLLSCVILSQKRRNSTFPLKNRKFTEEKWLFTEIILYLCKQKVPLLSKEKER